MNRNARIRGLSVARAVVIRADGSKEVHFSVPDLPWWHLRRRQLLRRHLRFMRSEDV